jgi:hypothetical protein
MPSPIAGSDPTNKDKRVFKRERKGKRYVGGIVGVSGKIFLEPNRYSVGVDGERGWRENVFNRIKKRGNG